MSVGSRILAARKRKEMNQRELGNLLGVTAATISDWERGKANPDVEKVSQLMSHLEVDANYLYQDSLDEKNRITEKELEMLSEFRELNIFNREVVEILIGSLLDRQFQTPPTVGADGSIEVPKRKIPMYFEMASAGKGNLLFDDPAPAMIEVLEDRPARRADFVLQVDGDSMEPRILNRDLILVKKQPLIEDGEIGIFLVDGKSFVKERRGKMLHSANPKYSDIPMTPETLCFGKVLGKARLQIENK